MYSCFAPVSQILLRRRSFDCRRDVCHCRQIIFQLQRLMVDSVCGNLFLFTYCKQRIFVVSHCECPSPPHPPFVCEKPWVVVRSLQLEPGWPAPSPASKPDADEKFMTVCLENPSHSIWSAALPLMLPPLIAAVSAASIRPALFCTVGVQTTERGWDGVHGFTLLPCVH